MMSSWLRRRFTYHDEFFENFPTDDDPECIFKSYRSHKENPDCGSSLKRDPSDYENLGDTMTASTTSTTSTTSSGYSAERYSRQSSSSPLDVSFMSEDSTTTLTSDASEMTVIGSVNPATPILRRRRSQLSVMRRNYRIISPDESILILQQQNQTQSTEKKKVLRRKSSKKELLQAQMSPPMVITPPVLLSRTQSCSLCSKERDRGYSFFDEMPPTHNSRLNDEQEQSRLSFVSSSTGYSSARSSLRSSDGVDESNRDRDSGVPSCSSLDQRAFSHLERIVIELIETEIAYVNDLSDVIQGYLNFLVERREDLGVTLEDVSSLFGCIERIHGFNSRLCHHLQNAGLDPVKISRCFVENAGKFEDYIAYCTNYHKMLGTLTALQQQTRVATALAERQQMLGHSLPLSAFLLKPVQRILKYHLFLDNMMKSLPSNYPADDSMIIRKAHEVMTSQAGRINDEKKKAEHTERVAQLQNMIQKWKVDQTANLSAYGDLVLEASFRQAGSKTTRLLLLFEEMLLIVKQRNTTFVCKDFIMCSNLMLNESICIEEPLAFQVLSFDNPRAQYVFLAASMEQKRVWMTELKRAMLDHYAIEIPEKTKQLMLSMDNTQRVAFGRPEFAEVSMKNHKKVPKYLEKRKKSMDQSENQRRRSLSASRLIGSSKSSLTESAKLKMFGVDDEQKCSCHLNPSTSYEDRRPQVSRTCSATTIDLDNSQQQLEISATTTLDVQTSRSRYHQARNRRQLPPRQESRAQSRPEDCDINATFEQVYKELVHYGQGAQTEAMSIWRQGAAVPQHLRSKSLTRLDDDRDDVHRTPTTTQPTSVELRPTAERRYSKLDQLKKFKSRKFTVCENNDAMTTVRPTSDVIRPLNQGWVSPRPQSRQRTPITVEQAAQLDQLLPTKGVVRSMIRQLETTPT